MEDRRTRTLAWMGLSARKNAGPITVVKEVARHGSATEVWERWRSENQREAADIQSRVEQQLDEVRALGGDAMDLHDARYPRLLAEISDPPPVLFFRGRWPSSTAWGRALAVVGTRSCSSQGAAWARQVGREWTEGGGLLVSGLARGVDGQAHRGALQGGHGGSQVAVLPCGLSAIHPRIHESLAQGILDAGGLLITEHPPRAKVERWMFASRNRILVGLALHTLVVQSPAKGGSLISARCAFQENRSVHAFWNPSMDASWSGNRALIADHVAQPVRDVGQFWERLSCGNDPEPLSKIDGCDAPTLPEGCERVWELMSERTPVSCSEMCQKLNVTADRLDHMLFTLEVQGWIRRLPGRRYLRG